MDEKILLEIKVRGEAAAVHEYDSITDLIYGRDVKTLLAEVKRQECRGNEWRAIAAEWQKKAQNAESEITTLKKALESVSYEFAKETSITNYDSAVKRLAKGIYNEAVERAQEQEGRK